VLTIFRRSSKSTFDFSPRRHRCTYASTRRRPPPTKSRTTCSGPTARRYARLYTHSPRSNATLLSASASPGPALGSSSASAKHAHRHKLPSLACARATHTRAPATPYEPTRRARARTTRAPASHSLCPPPPARASPRQPYLSPSTRTDTSSPSLACARATHTRSPATTNPHDVRYPHARASHSVRTHTTRARQDPLPTHLEPSITQPNPAVVSVPRLSPRPRQNPSAQPAHPGAQAISCVHPPPRAALLVNPNPFPIHARSLPTPYDHTRSHTIPHDPTRSHTIPHDPTRSHTSSS